MRSIISILTLIPAFVGNGEVKVCYVPPNPPPIKIKDTRSEKCLATMLFAEARGESKRGQVAVAYTALNRAVKRTICSVILAPYQYSAFNGNSPLRAVAVNKDAEPKLKNIIEKLAWIRSIQIAQQVIRKEVPDPTNGCTHYLNPEKVAILPKWANEYKLVTIIDNHKFYKKQS